MIWVADILDDRQCNACGSFERQGDFPYQKVKEIYFSQNGHASTCIALCSKCRERLINTISEADGWGKLLEVR